MPKGGHTHKGEKKNREIQDIQLPWIRQFSTNEILSFISQYKCYASTSTRLLLRLIMISTLSTHSLICFQFLPSQTHHSTPERYLNDSIEWICCNHPKKGDNILPGTNTGFKWKCHIAALPHILQIPSIPASCLLWINSRTLQGLLSNTAHQDC